MGFMVKALGKDFLKAIAAGQGRAAPAPTPERSMPASTGPVEWPEYGGGGGGAPSLAQMAPEGPPPGTAVPGAGGMGDPPPQRPDWLGPPDHSIARQRSIPWEG